MEEEQKPNIENNFGLDSDELQHFHAVEQPYTDRLYLANEGAIISVALSAEACRGVQAHSRQALLSMLTLKAADHLRLAATALFLGHYYSVPILLRSALDSIGVLYLVSRDDNELKKWAFLTYVSAKELGVDPIQLRDMREKFYQKARAAYDGLLSQDPQMQPVLELIREFNAHVHPGLEGLLEIVSIPLELDELLGVAVREVLEAAQGDLHAAVALLDLAGKYSQSKVQQKPVTEMEAREFGFGYFNEDLLDYYSSVLHAAAHHLFDIADDIFRDGVPKKLRKAGDEWHDRSLKELKTSKSQQKQQ